MEIISVKITSVFETGVVKAMPHTRFAGQKNNLYNGKG